MALTYVFRSIRTEFSKVGKKRVRWHPAFFFWLCFLKLLSAVDLKLASFQYLA